MWREKSFAMKHAATPDKPISVQSGGIVLLIAPRFRRNL
jgi:hypothetical protein